MIDLHSHILPGIDDGARDFDESVLMVRNLAEAGVTDVVATPHYVNETSYVSSLTANRKILARLRTRLKKEGVLVNLHLGNEIFVDEKMLDLLKDKKISGLNGSRYLLVEFSLGETEFKCRDLFLDLMAEGYKIVLAHPERYNFVQKDFKDLDELLEMGVLLQANLGSLVGKYGKKAEKIVRKMIKNGMVFGFGSDLHRPSLRGSLNLALLKLEKLYSADDLERVLVLNPRKILGVK